MKHLLTFLSLLLLMISSLAQPPGKMSYQAVIRNSSDQLVKNQKVTMRIGILQGSASGTAVYMETQMPKTNANGLVSIVIGDGNVVSGDFSTIAWDKGPFFIKTETDPNGGSNYSIIGVSQLLSVPYAFHATTAESLTNPVLESDPVFGNWDKSTGIRIKESQITDLDHFTNSDEIDPKYLTDSTYLKSGVRSWNSSLAKKIKAADTTRWGKPYTESDPIFNSWDKSTGIKIKESQITDLHHFTNGDETDPIYGKSVAKGITQQDTAYWNHKSNFSGNYHDLADRPTALSNFTNDMDFVQSIALSKYLTAEKDPFYVADSSFIKTGVRNWNNSLAKKIKSADTTRWGKAESDPLFSAWDKHSGISITESQISNLKHFTTADEIDPRYSADSSLIKTGVRIWNSSLAKKINSVDTTRWGKAESDPLFSTWDKHSGISITESQISNLKHFTTADEIDPRYAADSTTIKTGVRSWNSSLAKTIDASDTSYWGRAETDPYFTAWDKHTGISITESQITDLDHFTTADEIDPKYAVDSSYIKTGVRSWNSSLAKTIDAADTTHWGKAETDPYFSTWDKHTGISITESQISDLDHFTTSDEIDPRYAADSSFIKTGVRSWNSSLAKTIDATDTTRWGEAESDPVYSSSEAANITATDITNLGNLSGTNTGDQDLSGLAAKSALADTTAQLRSEIPDVSGFITTETDPVYEVDSSFIKTAVRSWNSSLAKNISIADTTRWGQLNSFDGNYSSLTNAPDIAVSTTNKNITLASGQTFSVKDASYTYLKVNQSDGLVGIGKVTTPRAALEVGGTDGLLVTGTPNSGTVRALGNGLRFHWYPRKGALRAGMAETTYWDDNGTTIPNMALYSCAIGYQPRATGIASYALGAFCKSTGDYALSMGISSEATASYAIAIGIGGSPPCRASGIYSIALGSGTDTNGKDGSMVVGDDTYYQTSYSSADNQLTMRFSGGYRFWTSYPDSTAGVYMRHGQNGWSGYCDRNRKENFKKLDYEEVLKKIDEDIPITEWNYKKIDTIKYIGPMAQDFYKAFQLGGTDSLGINSICIDGVNMAAIHGLIDRTDLLKNAVEELKAEQQKNAELESLYKEQSEVIKEMRKELDELKAEISNSTIKSKDPLTEK
jgi:hypothetical protein